MVITKVNRNSGAFILAAQIRAFIRIMKYATQCRYNCFAQLYIVSTGPLIHYITVGLKIKWPAHGMIG